MEDLVMEKMQVNKISEDTKKSMWTRTITAAILALIGIPTILIGGWWFLIFISVALLIIIHEFINAPIHKRYSTFVHGFIYVMTFSFVFWIRQAALAAEWSEYVFRQSANIYKIR